MPRDDIPLCRPGPERIARANLTTFIRSLHNERVAETAEIADYATLSPWSVERRASFWPAVWRFCGIRADERPGGNPWDTVGIAVEIYDDEGRPVRDRPGELDAT